MDRTSTAWFSSGRAGRPQNSPQKGHLEGRASAPALLPQGSHPTAARTAWGQQGMSFWAVKSVLFATWEAPGLANGAAPPPCALLHPGRARRGWDLLLPAFHRPGLAGLARRDSPAVPSGAPRPLPPAWHRPGVPTLHGGGLLVGLLWPGQLPGLWNLLPGGAAGPGAARGTLPQHPHPGEGIPGAGGTSCRPRGGSGGWGKGPVGVWKREGRTGRDFFFSQRRWVACGDASWRWALFLLTRLYPVGVRNSN